MPSVPCHLLDKGCFRIIARRRFRSNAGSHRSFLRKRSPERISGSFALSSSSSLLAMIHIGGKEAVEFRHRAIGAQHGGARTVGGLDIDRGALGYRRPASGLAMARFQRSARKGGPDPHRERRTSFWMTRKSVGRIASCAFPRILGLARIIPSGFSAHISRRNPLGDSVSGGIDRFREQSAHHRQCAYRL